jgi:hypothetical protein
MTPPTLTPQTRLRRAVDIPFTKVHDQMLALDEDAGYYYALNETSHRVWELLAEPFDTAQGKPTTVESVCARLCQEFSVDPDTCQREILHLLHGLHEAGLVQISE